MDTLLQIKSPVEAELEAFQTMFYDLSLEHENPLLSMALAHVFKRHGKMMRPVLVMLFAKMAGRVTDQVLHAAASLEMLHTASLVHDDVVDESNRRRGQQSVNAMFDNKAAVLVGDYLLSTALKHAALTGDSWVVERVAWLGQTLSDGELLQLAALDSEEICEQAYLDIIFCKTASLFTVCSQLGAKLGGAGERILEAARLFGEYIGICFQIRDDIFDYFDTDVTIGKPAGNDMKEGKLTLPVVYAVTQPGAERMRELALKVRKGYATADDIAGLITYTKEHGGIEYARRRMLDYHGKAVSLLQDFPAGVCRDALKRFADFVVERSL